jgi:hypothetical protein
LKNIKKSQDMKKFIIPFLCSVVVTAQAKDTIRVELVNVTSPIALSVEAPYTTDSIDNKGNRYRATQLDDHATPAFAKMPTSETLEKGMPLTSIDSLATLRVLQFGVRSDRYAKVLLDIKNVKNYRLFVNGKTANTSLTMTPGHYDVRLVCLTEKDT